VLHEPRRIDVTGKMKIFDPWEFSMRLVAEIPTIGSMGRGDTLPGWSSALTNRRTPANSQRVNGLEETARVVSAVDA
jgi:hypothetical protein